MRDELLDVEEFSCLAEARVVIDDWREDYNQRRPHSALGMRTPAVFAAEWATTPAAAPPDPTLAAARHPPGGAAASAPRPSPLRLRGYAARLATTVAHTLPATEAPVPIRTNRYLSGPYPPPLSLVVDRQTGSGQPGRPSINSAIRRSTQVSQELRVSSV